MPWFTKCKKTYVVNTDINNATVTTHERKKRTLPDITLRPGIKSDDKIQPQQAIKVAEIETLVQEKPIPKVTKLKIEASVENGPSLIVEKAEIEAPLEKQPSPKDTKDEETEIKDIIEKESSQKVTTERKLEIEGMVEKTNSSHVTIAEETEIEASTEKRTSPKITRFEIIESEALELKNTIPVELTEVIKSNTEDLEVNDIAKIKEVVEETDSTETNNKGGKSVAFNTELKTNHKDEITKETSYNNILEPNNEIDKNINTNFIEEVVNNSHLTNGKKEEEVINGDDRRLTTEELEEIQRRGGFRGDTIDIEQEIIKYPKTIKEESSIKSAVVNNEFLYNILKEEQLKSIIDAMCSREVKKSEIIINQGDDADYMFASESGSFEIIIDGTVVNTFNDQRIFGELAILYNNVRLATIKAVTNGRLWMLHRKVYQQIVITNALAKEQEMISFLRKVPIVQKASETKLQKMVNLLKTEFFKPESIIIKQGDKGDKFYIIVAGTSSVIIEGSGKVATLTRGEYFGERALLHEDCRQATVAADINGVECLVLSRPDFIENLGDLNDFLEKEEPPSRLSSVSNVISEYDHIVLNDLKRVKTLGVGGFGRVELLQHKKDDKLVFALKYLKKYEMLEKKQRNHALNEKIIQAGCSSDFVAKLYKTYQDKKYLYFLMECCLGGDLFSLLQKQKGRCFDDAGAKFMAGCVLEALSYLHEREYVYRDLKPENILIDSRGYAKLTDFGFAKKLQGGKKTYTFAGTPEYVAPEIVYNRGHNKEVDYWAFGIFIFELYTGRTPFRTSDVSHSKTYALILKGIDNVMFPGKIPNKAQSIIRKLCKQVASERLGCQKNGAQDVRNHKWFSNFEWQKLRDHKMKAPFLPKLDGYTDTKYFDKFDEDTYIPEDVDDDAFEGF